MGGQGLFGRLVGDSALYGISAAVAKALALLTVPFLTRTLTPSGYGIADLATSTAAFLTLVAMFAGDIPAARAHAFAADKYVRTRTLASYVWATAAVSVGLAIALLPLASSLAGGLWGSDSLGGLATLTLVLVPISAVQASLVQTQRIRQKAATFALLSLVDLLAQLALAVAFVALGLGPVGVVMGFIVGSLIGLVAAAVAAKDLLTVSAEPQLAWDIVSRGLKFLPHATVFVGADWALRAIVANLIGTVAVAEIGLAIRIASALSLVGTAFAMAWGPVGLARVHDRSTALLFGRVLTLYGGTSIALALAMAATGPELLTFVAGPGYEGAALVLPGLALAFALAGTEYVLVVAAGVLERPSRVAVAVAAGGVTQLGAALILIPSLGVAAVGISAVLGRSISFVVLLATVREVIIVPVGLVIGGAVLAFLSFVAVQAAVATGDGWVIRWTFAIAVTAAVAGLAARLVGRKRAMPA